MSGRKAYLDRLWGQPYDKWERNCWTVAGEIQQTLFGRTLPSQEPALVADPRLRAEVLASHPGRSAWREIPQPADGALVLMGKVKGRETHCGVALIEDDGTTLVWHSDHQHGVVADTPLELAHSRHWILSYWVPREA